MRAHQYQLSLIQHHANGATIKQRRDDGYVNATELCKAAGKDFDVYRHQPDTLDYLAVLSPHIRIPVDQLVQDIPSSTGDVISWVHPKVAINLGLWLSPEFAVKVSEWVYGWLNDGSKPTVGILPPHIQRYIANDPKVLPGYFSVLQETVLNLVGPLNNVGFDIPKDWVPDISVGKAFCAWLRSEKSIDTNKFLTYRHDYGDGRKPVNAYLYPDELLADFRRWFRLIWLPQNGVKYFRKKDPDSLSYLDQLPALAAPTVN